jgi:hypothetical protein
LPTTPSGLSQSSPLKVKFWVNVDVFPLQSMAS